MKKGILLLYLLFAHGFTFGQNDAIILVDVSGTINQSYYAAGKNAIKSLILGNPLPPEFISNISDSSFQIGKPLISIGSRLLLLPLGKSRIDYNSFKYKEIHQIPSDLDDAFLNYPPLSNDGCTYMKLPIAVSGFKANEDSIPIYYLITVSDKVDDNCGASYTKIEDEITTRFGDNNHKLEFTNIGSIQYRNTPFKLYIQKYDISSWTPSHNTVVKSNLPKIVLSSYANGTDQIPKEETGTNDLFFTWYCPDCPSQIPFSYTLNVVSLDNNPNNNKPPILLNTNSTKINLDNGRVKVFVTGRSQDGKIQCQPSDSSVIEINTSSYWGWVIFIIGMIAGFMYLILLYNKRRRKTNSKVIKG